jgi:hypothetical protein
MPWRAAEGQRGAALIWLAFMMTFLIGAAAFAVDLGWLYVNSSRVQRAADAAALGGVTYMPSFPALAQSTAVDVGGANGYTTGVSGNATYSYPPPPEEYQFSVAISTQVNTFFLRVFGQDTVAMTRQATAEYVLPLPIGSPESNFGVPSQGFWAAISGPYTARGQGDFYATRCLTSNSGSSCTSNNPNYRPSGYWYAVDVPAGSSGLDIDLYDAGYYNRSGFSSETGDYNYGGGGYGGVTTSWSVYAPDSTPLDPTDNPIATCSLGMGPSVTLAPESSSPNTRNQWNRLCRINSTVPGRYILNVRSTGNGYATNQYSIRATSLSGPNPSISGINDISIFVNVNGSATFYLAKVDEIHAGKDLEVVIFDPGDANGTNRITIRDPYNNIPWCSFQVERADGSIEDTGSGGCTIDATKPTHDYNEDIVRVTIPLPAGYTCNPAGAYGGCWWRITYEYQNQPSDRTVWEARIKGNPIHLVQD